MTEATHPTRLAIAQQFLMHIGHRDFDQCIELLSPRATMRVPGRHALAGVFSGREEILKVHNRFAELTIGTFDTIKWEDWMVGEQHVAGLELKATIQDALKQLSPELREAVILRDLEDMDYKEIAQVLRIPEGTVKSRISRGRGELARLLQRIERQIN